MEALQKTLGRSILITDAVARHQAALSGAVLIIIGAASHGMGADAVGLR